MTPIYFGDCFGWVQPAQGGRGVVICSAMGVEDLCTHRFMRHLADELATSDIPSLRFDYPGMGDSLGSDIDADRVECWINSIGLAMETLRAQCGVTEIALVGFRIGSLLAMYAAQKFEHVKKVVLLAPVTSGKSYLRETRALGMLIADSARTTSEQDEAVEIEAAGFYITKQTADQLRQLDLMLMDNSPAKDIFILGKLPSKADTRLAEHFSQLGASVMHGELSGLADLQWDSTFAELPPGAFSTAVDWLAKDAPAKLHHAATIAPISELRGEHWREQPVQFGRDDRLFGIHTRSHTGSHTDSATSTSQPVQQAVLFVNHGSNHHIGWARLHVTLARRFARAGVDSLRFDISGVGDSPAHPGYAENLLYARHSQLDVYAAVAWLKARGYEKVTVTGHCAGAYLGFYSALRDPRITSLVMLNLQRFFWPRGDSLKAISRQGIRATGWYWQKLWDPVIWRRLVAGQVNVFGIAKKLLQRLLRRVSGMFINTVGPLIGMQGLSHKVLRWLRELSQRNVRVLIVYSAADGGLDELATYVGSNAKRARKLSNIELRVIEGADHNMTPAWAQEQYAQILEAFLLR